MPTEKPRSMIEAEYYWAAQEYLRNLPLEHFMEATPQATQRKITLESLDLVAAQRTDFHLFNELLVQYPRKGEPKRGQVVPDNMVVLYEGQIDAETSYDVPLQPAPPFWMLEYVSKSSERKDYDDNMVKYEKELKTPYYLLFYPETQDLTLFKRNTRRYVSVKPNGGRCGIPELEIEVALVNGWVRYWYQGELLPLPAELLEQANELRRLLGRETARADAAERRADTAEQEMARLRAELERLRHQE